MSHDVDASLHHDIATAAAASIHEVFAPLLREEDQQDAYTAIYERVRAALEFLQIHSARIERAAAPGRN